MSWPETRLADLDVEALERALLEDIDLSRTWPIKADRDGARVAVGRLPGLPCKAYRSEVELAAPIDDVASFIADDIVVRLPEWNREFHEGQVVDVVEDSDVRKAWLVHIFYRTPAILKDREYLHYLSRRALDEDRVLIAYHSVDDEEIPVRDGFVRGVLYRTVHLLTRIGPQRTQVEHILANDVRGRIPLWVQNHVFARGFVAANLRDSIRQGRIFG